MTTPDFRYRSTQDELMDGENISFEEFHHCLVSLEKINVLTLAYRPVLKWMKRFKSPLKVLDAGSGGGDMLRRLAGLENYFTMIGVDLNPWSKRSAELSGPVDPNIQYQTADIFSFNATDKVDVIISSLFTHHLTDDQLVQFLQWMDRTAQRGWFINDLHRHWLPYYFITFAVRIFSRNRLIRHDAPVSVARSFTRHDWQEIIRRAGISANTVHIRWFFPFRYCVSCEK